MVDEKAVVRKFQRELNSGTVSLVALGLMDASDEPLYGYQIAKLLEERAEGRLPMKQGALYPVLRAMEANGLLQSQVEPSTSAPPRRYYTVTEGGHRMLARWMEVWGGTRDFVERVLAGLAGDGDNDEESEDV
ncbi:MAG: PadR family transcriptional regulator [Acidobacteria bacterium]|nr:PadR family transcriptional regulator [Acidobacteriota bacterium]